MTLRWYAIQIKPALLITAQQNLERQDFRSFFPRVVLQVTKRETTEEPLFRGYGFVQFDIAADPWRSINGTKGVVKLLPKHQETPTPMTEGFVEHLLDRDPLYLDEFRILMASLVVGKEVEITHGLMEGRRGVLNRLRGRFGEIIFPLSSGNSAPILLPTNAMAPVRG